MSSAHGKFPRLFAHMFSQTFRPLIVVIGVVLGFLFINAVYAQPNAPEARLPAEYRLNALITRYGEENTQQREEIQRLSEEANRIRERNASRSTDMRDSNLAIKEAERNAGIHAVTGEGFTATLRDSVLTGAEAGTKNLNDLVIHSQDVQTVVNAMWAAKAEAVAVNEQRIVSTSAVLCVGNTLLINGTVHAPPYNVAAIGADRSLFESDPGIRRLFSDAERYGIGVSVGRTSQVSLPAYTGSRLTKYAKAL